MNISKLKAYLKVWTKLTRQQFQSQIANARGAAFLFISGKLIRLGASLLFVYVVVGRATLISGYTLSQAIFLMVLFNLTSTIGQLFLRGVYMFRQKVIDGSFDFYLLNPLSELFYALFSFTDPMDLILLIPYILLTLWAWANTGAAFTALNLALIVLIIVLAVIMMIAWHIIIVSVGVKYLEVDNSIMLFRDLEKMGSFPVSLYGRTGENIMTYIFPFALMATIPANLVLGNFNPWFLIVFAVLAVVQLKLSIWIWNQALKSYSSASS